MDQSDIAAASKNIDAAPLEEREKILLRIALKAVNTPEAVNRDDVDAAHSHGWRDRDIFDLVAAATATNRSFNIMLKTFNVDGLGVFN